MRCRRRLASKLLASERDESGPACVGEIAEVSDADETSGQHMLAESAQELACGWRHDALLVTVRVVFPSEAYALTVEAEVGHGEQVLLTPGKPALARLCRHFGQCRLRQEL